MTSFCKSLVVGLLAAWCCAAPLGAAEKPESPPETAHPAAVFAFQERGDEVKGFGKKVTDLLVAALLTRHEMFLVDREDMDKVLNELGLNVSGAVKPEEAARVRQLTGAKILVTGSVIQVDTHLYLVAKIVGTETSRVLGASAKGKTTDDLAVLVDQLADQVAKTIKKQAGQLVARPASAKDRIAVLKEKLGAVKRPAVLVSITERHVGQATADPAAATEIMALCEKLGFRVIDPKQGSRSDADVLVTGEGLTETAARHGNLISVKGRLELKAVDRPSGRLLFVDRHVAVAVDLTEQIAGKQALEEAAGELAERMLPKIVGPGKKERGAK